MHILRLIKAQAGKLKDNITELYTLLLIVVGLPAVAYIYIDWKLALTVFILVQIALGFFSLRFGK